MPTSGSGSATGPAPAPIPAPPTTSPRVRYYPVSTDLVSFLGGSTLLDIGQARTAVLAGIEQFEGEVERHMLAGYTHENRPVAEAMRTFDPPCERPILRIPDLPSDGDPPGIVYAPANQTPTTFAAGTDFIMMPEEAPGRGMPWTSVRLKRRWWGHYGLGDYAGTPWFDQIGSIQITGLWGYATTIPDDAWEAMLIAAAQGFLMRSSLALAGGAFPVKRWSAPGGVSTEYDTEFFSRTSSGWQRTYDLAVTNYVRLEFG